jgi:1-acyl-sn-glycerol-3-phosphate acyltransferase
MGPYFMLLCMFAVFFRGEFLLLWMGLRSPRVFMEWLSRYQPRISRRLFSFARMLGGMRSDIQGFPGALPPVFAIISNHQSLVDIPAIAIAFPTRSLRWVAKKELGRGIPFVSRSLRFGQSALISRKSDFRAGQKELKRFAALARQGICPVIFPEGSRSRTGMVKDFFAGAVRTVLEQESLPVLSVAVDGGYRVSTLPHLLLHVRGTLYRVKPLTLYPAPHGKREVMELLSRIHDEIGEQVTAWRHADGSRA